MKITKISKTPETGIEAYTVEEFRLLLEKFVLQGWSNHKLAIDDSCGHWYWIVPTFEVITIDNDTFVEVAISDDDEYEFRDDEVQKEEVEAQAPIADILEGVKAFITEENSSLQLYAHYDCSRGGGLNVPSNRFTESNEFGVPQVDLHY